MTSLIKTLPEWHFDKKSNSLVIDLIQSQTGADFQFPLDIGWIGMNGKLELTKVLVTAKSQKFTIPASSIPNNLFLDPNTWLLFEGSISQK